MDKKHKTFFLLYPFIGFISFIKWFFIGIFTTSQYIINIFIYAFLGLKYVLTLPFSNKQKRVITPEINIITDQTKAERINALMNQLPEHNTIVQNENELPMLNTTQSNFSEEISKDV